MKFLKNHWYDLALALSVLVLILLNVFFLQNWIDSDMAAEMVFSRLISEEGGLISSVNWFYSTEFRILYSQLIMVPLFKLTSNFYVVRFVMNLVFYGLMLWSYFFMMKPLKLKRKSVVISAIVLMLPFSETLMLHVFMGNTYMPHIIISFVMMGLFLRGAFKTTKTKWGLVLVYIFYALLSLICGMSGVRYFLAVMAPTLLGAFIYALSGDAFRLYRFTPKKDYFKTWVTGSDCKPFFLSIYSLVAGMLGYLVNIVYISNKYQFQTYESTNFILVYDGDLMDRIQRCIGSFLQLFGYIDNKPVLSVRGLITVISFVLPASLIYAAAKAKTDNKAGNFLRTFFFTTLSLNTFIFIFTNSTLVARYYITVMIFTLPLLALFLESKELTFDKNVLLIILFACLTLASLKEIGSIATQNKNEAKEEVAEYLTEEGYKFGYATYWNAGILTELSDGALEVAGLYYEDLSLFKWSAPAKYYESGYYDGEVFLILTDEEAESDMARKFVDAGELIYDNKGYKIYTYDSMSKVVDLTNE